MSLSQRSMYLYLVWINTFLQYVTKLVTVSTTELTCVFKTLWKIFIKFFLISFVALHTLYIWVSCIHILTYKLCIYLFADFADLFIFFVRLDRKLVLNLTLSINLVLYFIVLPFFYCFIGTKKIMYFSPFSLRHSNCPLNSCVIRFIKKW